MSAESRYMQLLLLGYVGGAKIVESPWTEIAKGKKVDVGISSVIHRKANGIRLGRNNIIDNRYFESNEWSKFRESIPTYHLTIQQYKASNRNHERPDWAKTYSERGIGTKYDYKILPAEKSEFGRFHSVESERLSSTEDAIVFRFNDIGGCCRRVRVGYPDKDGLYVIRTEDWVSKGRWEVKSLLKAESKDVQKLLKI